MIKVERLLLLSVVGACVGSSAGDPATGTTTQEVSGSTASAQVPSTFLRGASPHAASHTRVGGHRAGVPNSVPGVDSLANFGGQFTLAGFDGAGNPQSVWPYTMVGAGPASNHPTVIRAPIIPVTVELLDATGAVGTTPGGAPLRMVIDQGTVDATVQSPVFQPFTYNSGRGQFNDQMMRSMFWGAFPHHGHGDDDNSGYHTVLAPAVVAMRTIQIPFGAYRYAPKPDGSCCMFVLADINQFATQLFPPTPTDTATVLGSAEHTGEATTRDITTLLFKDVYLYDGDPANCCILGFHSYDSEPGDASNHNRERRYVMNYSSWITPGLFGFGYADITAFSHEMSELFADPFVDNATPWWLSQDPVLGSALCQNNLETGDVVEVLNNPVHAIPMAGRTYHPQNEAMLPWFSAQSPSTAFLGAYSFPDETVLLGPGPQGLHPGCTP